MDKTDMPEKIWACVAHYGASWVDKYPVWGGSTQYTLSSLCVTRSEYDKLKQHADRLADALEKSLRLCKKYIEENYPKEHHSGHETVMGYLTPMQQALAEYRKETE